MISAEEKERVVQATDFVGLVGETVMLHEKSAGDFWGRCPFHEERTESFHVSADRGLCYCFGCGAKGDVIDYVKRRENLEFADAVRYLADRAHIELHESAGGAAGPGRGRLIACLEEAQRHFARLLLSTRDQAGKCQQARDYLSKRSLGRDVSLRWGLGFSIGRGDLVSHLRGKGFSPREIIAADLGVEGPHGLRDRFYERVMFPIRDAAGSVIGFGGRVIDTSLPKYLNSRDSSIWHKRKNFYALDRAKESITATGRAVIVEGYTDAIALHEAGITNAVAILGTALTSDHLKVLDRYRPREIVSLLDGDEAGQRAAEKIVALVGSTRAKLLCVVLPEGKDPAEYLEAEGPQEMMKRLSEASDLVLFVIERRLAQARGASVGERAKILEDICAILAPLSSQPLALSSYAGMVADAFSIDEAQVHERIRRAAAAQQMAPRPRDDFRVQSREGGSSRDEGEPGEPLPDLSRMSTSDRSRILSERELLAALSSRPQAFARQMGRIGALSWGDARHGRIAAALVATPNASAHERLAAARAVDAFAPQILAASEFDREGRWGEAEAAFLVDQVELQSLSQELRRTSSELHAAEISRDETRIQELMQIAQPLRARISELEASVRSWNDHRE